MSDDVDSRITPALHPLNVREIDGFCEETAPLLASTESAFRSCYAALGDVHNARETAAKNPAWNEAAQIIQTDNLARKYREKITSLFDGARNRLIDNIANIERELSAPVAGKSSLQIAGEIRAHCKGLKVSERMDFVRRLIFSGDELSVSAICGGPAYLSGIDDEMRTQFTRMWNEHNSPAATLRLNAMRGAVDLIERNAPLMHGQFAKAVGCPPHKAAALHAANSAAEKAMVLRDLT